MKILKILGIIILVIVVLVLGVLLFGPSTVHMEREIVINTPVENVFDELNSFRTFDQYSAWSEIDTTAEITMSGVGVGAVYSWTSNNPDLGIGSIEIIESKENELIKSSMSFEGYPGEPIASWILSEESGKTKVTYTYDESDISGIWKLFAMATESMLSPMYERTLEKLKQRIENGPQFSSEIGTEMAESATFIGVNTTFSMTDPEMDVKVGAAFGKVMSYLESNEIEMMGAPMAVCTSFDESAIGMICGFPVANGVSIDSDELVLSTTPEGLVIRAIHNGAYANLQDTHEEIDQYAQYYNLEVIGYPWEVYLTDPEIESDTAKWVTHVYYPVK